MARTGDQPAHDLLTSYRTAFLRGYGHDFLFASAAAVGAGLAADVDVVTAYSVLGPVSAGYAVAIPVAVFVCCLWVLLDRPEYARKERSLQLPPC